MRLLDRYILRNFLVPFLLCFLGFLSIWLVFDFSDNASDFLDGGASPGFILNFYLVQLPQFALICLPVGLLLALLYAMSRMSRSNEIIAMLTAGQSLGRLLMPLMIIGVVLSLACVALNHSLAPRAESRKKLMLDQLGKKKEKNSYLESQLFRNRSENRTWYVRRMPVRANNKSVLQGLHITQQDGQEIITTKWYAKEAKFRPANETDPARWMLTEGKTVHFKPSGDVESEEIWDKLTVTDWNETPWRVASSNVDAQGLSVSDLRDYLKFNADFPDTQLAAYRSHLQYRWALPWSCLVIVFIAAPLGVVYSRRGVMAGVAGAIFLFAANTFLNYLLLAFGKGSIVSPFVAAWGSNIAFGLIGLYLLYLRSENRELPKISRLFGLR